MRLEYEVIRFTIIPDQGTQVWATIPVVRYLPSQLNTDINCPGNNIRRLNIRAGIQLRRNQPRNQRQRTQPRLTLSMGRINLPTAPNKERQNSNLSTNSPLFRMDRRKHGLNRNR
jgi:hypothetical protein